MTSVLITGTNRGIGLGFVREYLARGTHVFAACRVPDEAIHLQQLKQTHGNQLTLIPMEVTNPDDIQAAARRVQAETSALDILINNAGVFFPSKSFNDLSPEALARSFAVNSIAPLQVIGQFLPLLQNSSAPTIVNITMPTRPLSKLQRTEHHGYIASRYALNALTKMLALELKAQGVTVVALWPGYLQTDMNNMAAEATPPEQALPQVVDLIERLTLEQTGTCLLPDGTTFDW